MVNKILSTIMVTAVIVAAIVGLIFRQTYTNITTEPNFMEEHFSVALYDLDLAPDLINEDSSPPLIEVMRTELPNSNLIVRVKSHGKSRHIFKNTTQYADVLEVYQGDEVEVGDEIGITYHGMFFFDDMSANLNFVNFLQPNDEYLLFLDQRVDSHDPKDDSLYEFNSSVIPGIFNYEEKDHTIMDVPETNWNVPYSKVKDNEFFVSSEANLEALTELKHELLELYPR